MKIQSIKKGLFFLIMAAVYTVNAQQQVIANGVAFKTNIEVVTAQISNETISLVLSEIDKTNPNYQKDNCTDCPVGNDLILDVNFNRGFKFPITAKDSVFMNLSTFQDNLAAHKHQTNQVENIENSRDIPEENTLKTDAESIKQKGMEIAKLMQEGKITPQEAQEQLLTLTEPFNEDLDDSAIKKNTAQEREERSNYSILFYNGKEITKTETYSGYLYIKAFNERRFIAEYKGVIIEQCREKRIAKSKEAAAKCRVNKSQYLPDTKVLSEGHGTIFINVSIQEFLNNR